MNRCRYTLIAAITLALAAFAWAACHPGESVASSATALARCHTGQLTVRLRFGPGSGSAGHFTGALLFRNRSPTRCSLRGYPGVSFVDAHGNQIGLPVDRAPGHVGTVTVAPGRTVGAQLTLVDVGVFDQAVCRPTRVSGLRVYPPSDVRALFTRHALTECRRHIHEASVEPIVALSQLIPGTF